MSAQSITDKDFINSWKNLTINHLFFFDFFRAWMIFNRLYTITPKKSEQYKSFNEKNSFANEPTDFEREKIYNFIVFCLLEFQEKKGIKSVCDSFLHYDKGFVVQIGADNREVDCYSVLLNSLDNLKFGLEFKKKLKRIVKVFLKVYRVRCNLLHGEKDSRCEHDKRIIKKSTEILMKFINLYVECINDFEILNANELD